MKHRLLHHSAVAQVLDDDSLQQRRCNVGVPDAFGIHHDDRPSGADAQARRLAALHAIGSEQQIFSLEQLREQAVERSAAALRRAESSGADEDVTPIRVHACGSCDGLRGLDWPMSD